MPRQSSLAVPLAEHSSTHRRSRSAGDQSNASTRTPTTPVRRKPFTPGTSRSHPIALSSDEDEGDDEDDNTTTVVQAPEIAKIRDDSSQPPPSLAKHPRFQQPTTPDRTRPELPREPASDPGPQPRVRQEAFHNRPIAYQQRDELPCGRKPYTSPMGKWSQKHQNECEECQEQQRENRETYENATKQSEGGKEGSMLQRSTMAERHYSNNGKENKQKPASEKDGQSALMLHHRLIQTAKEKLTADEEGGYLYIFRNPEKPGLLKLGYSKNVWERGKVHKKKCGLVLTWVNNPNYVEKMKRAEKLAKLDMDHLRRDWKCSSCSQTHHEWFEVDEENAKKVAKKWTKWINEQNPYDGHGNLKPIWSWLMDIRRALHHDFEENGHEARWTYWNKVLSPPSRAARAEYDDRDKPRAVDQQQDSEAKILAYRQPTSKGQQDVIVQHKQTIVEQAVSKAMDVKPNGSTYIIINNLHVHKEPTDRGLNLSLS